MLPNFLIIGAAKAGTTSLYNYLRVHPQVFMSNPKELKFFVQEMNWSRGLQWYERHFDPAGDVVAIGEASTHYTAYPYFGGVPERIAEVLPDVRLIYLVRQPIDRMVSFFLMRIRAGKERERSMEKALLANPRYIDGSRYAMQIEQYLKYFPREHLVILKSEDLRNARGPTMDRVLVPGGTRSDARQPRPRVQPDTIDSDACRSAGRPRDHHDTPARAGKQGSRVSRIARPQEEDRAVGQAPTRHDEDGPPRHDLGRREVRARGAAASGRPAPEDLHGRRLRRLGHRMSGSNRVPVPTK